MRSKSCADKQKVIQKHFVQVLWVLAFGFGLLLLLLLLHLSDMPYHVTSDRTQPACPEDRRIDL